MMARTIEVDQEDSQITLARDKVPVASKMSTAEVMLGEVRTMEQTAPKTIHLLVALRTKDLAGQTMHKVEELITDDKLVSNPEEPQAVVILISTITQMTEGEEVISIATVNLLSIVVMVVVEITGIITAVVVIEATMNIAGMSKVLIMPVQADRAEIVTKVVEATTIAEVDMAADKETGAQGEAQVVVRDTEHSKERTSSLLQAGMTLVLMEATMVTRVSTMVGTRVETKETGRTTEQTH